MHYISGSDEVMEITWSNVKICDPCEAGIVIQEYVH